MATAAPLPDWARETKVSFFEWAPYKSLLAAIRYYQANRDKGGVLSAIRWRLGAARWRFWSVVGGVSIPVRCQIGGGLQMPHTNGIVISVGARIGCNCDIYQQVTIGEMKGGYPVIGNSVFIGPGAKILGAVKIGDGACIGANALVIQDVPAGARVFATPSEIPESVR
ncbi:MAG: serine acetyltransferase [Sphingomonas sp.]|nr:serine acetyltransferase [Sphingomonas sp.]